MAYCKDYENRPLICREFSCGKDPCEHCGGCCHDVVMSYPPGLQTLVEEDTFFRLHGIFHVDGGIAIRCRCKNLIEGPVPTSTLETPETGS